MHKKMHTKNRLWKRPHKHAPITCLSGKHEWPKQARNTLRVPLLSLLNQSKCVWKDTLLCKDALQMRKATGCLTLLLYKRMRIILCFPAITLCSSLYWTFCVTSDGGERSSLWWWMCEVNENTPPSLLKDMPAWLATSGTGNRRGAERKKRCDFTS